MGFSRDYIRFFAPTVPTGREKARRKKNAASFPFHLVRAINEIKEAWNKDDRDV